MLKPHILEQVNQQINQVISNSPLNDIEKALKATVIAILHKLDLVTREEFDTQQKVLADTRKKLEILQKQLENLD